MIYNSGQRSIIEEGRKWYKYSSEQLFQFSGPAGTGKSVVLNAIIDAIGVPRHRIAPMAYIGQAAIVMRMKGLRNAKTAHSWLFNPVETYKLDKNNQIITNNYFDRPEYTLGFEPKSLDEIDLIVVDEGSTIPWDLRMEMISRGKKILVAGDLDQLPPVEGEPGFLTTGKVHFLAEPMRQSSNSAILYLADRARAGLPIQKGFYGNCLVIDEDELSDEMIINSDIVITCRNATRDAINNRVRYDILGINTDLPMMGERMICRKNNWRIELDGINLANGLIGSVANSPGVEGFDGNNFTIDFKPNMLNNYFEGVQCDYKYLIATQEQKRLLKNSKYNRAEKFEFAYGITCHLSQGGQFNNGIYMEEFLSNDIQKNLNYTGITRFAHSLTYVKRRRKKMYFFR